MEKKWTAFLRLKGKTQTKKAERILEEFDGLVKSLRGVDIDYNIIVFVEGKGPKMLRPQNSVQSPETRVPSEKGGV
jgi:hypothetical protein